MQEIQASNWAALCERLNRFERGARVDIHWIDRATMTDKEIASAAQFQDIAFGKRNGCSDQITVRAAAEIGSQTRHDIIEPIHVFLGNAADGHTHNTVSVDAEEGTAILTFHPGIRREWLAGLIRE